MNILKFTILYIIVVFFIIFCFLSANLLPIDYKKNIALDYLPKSHAIQYIVGDNKNELISKLKDSKIQYPIIIKPNWCSTHSRNIKKASNINESIEIINTFSHSHIMIQEFDDSEFEGSILYEKYPFSNKADLIVLVKKIPEKGKYHYMSPSTTQREDITSWLTDKLINKIEEISKNIPGFNVGRYDIKFKNKKELQNGNFKVIELNGTIGADARIFIKTRHLLSHHNIILQIRWFLKRIIIGFTNNIHPFKIITNIKKIFNNILNMVGCDNSEAINIYLFIVVFFYFFLLFITQYVTKYMTNI